jgi:hypothetical protein
LAIERRLKLLFKGSDEWVLEILTKDSMELMTKVGPGWETEKALATVRTLRALCDGMTPEEATMMPVK